MLKDSTVEYRPVTLGPLVDGLRVVTEGLAAGDVMVVNGLQHVRPGMAVDPQRVAMESRSLDANSQLATAGSGNGKVAARN